MTTPHDWLELERRRIRRGLLVGVALFVASIGLLVVLEVLRQ